MKIKPGQITHRLVCLEPYVAFVKWTPPNYSTIGALSEGVAKTLPVITKLKRRKK